MEKKKVSGKMLKSGNQLASEMHKLDKLTQDITDKMNNIASGAVRIVNAVQQVNDITLKNTESIQNLAEEVGKFKV